MAENVVVSIGHTNAEAQQIADAVSAGATMSTHLGNGAHGVHAPASELYLGTACRRPAARQFHRGWHSSAGVFSESRAAREGRGSRRCWSPTPARRRAAQPGRYRLGEQEVDLTPDNRVVLAGQDRLAGSALRMDRGVENLMRLGEIEPGGCGASGHRQRGARRPRARPRKWIRHRRARRFRSLRF